MSRCSSPETLAAHTREELDPVRRREVEAHLATCERCRLGVLLISQPAATSGAGATMKAESPGEGHLEPQEVYQLIEKSLSGKKRREVEDHLDRCPECVRYVATVLAAEAPASVEEEAALRQIPSASPAQLLDGLRSRIVATSPGSRRGWRLNWGKVMPVAAAVAGMALFLVWVQSYVIAPLRSRNLVARAITDLISLRQGTGRVPLRYIAGFQRALVTRSGFDQADPAEQAMEAEIESRLRRAVELAPREVGARIALGLYLLDSGRLDEAEASLREVIELDPNVVEAINGLGVLYFERSLRDPSRAGELKREGLSLLLRAREIDPDNLMVLYNLAAFYQETGAFLTARQAWLAYLNEDARSEWSEVARENLRSLGFR